MLLLKRALGVGLSISLAGCGVGGGSDSNGPVDLASPGDPGGIEGRPEEARPGSGLEDGPPLGSSRPPLVADGLRARIAAAVDSAAPGDTVHFTAVGLVPGVRVVATQPADVAPEYRLCGAAFADGYGVAHLSCRLAPETRDRALVNLHEESLLGARLASAQVAIENPSSRLHAAAVREGANVEIEVAGNASAGRRMILVLHDPRGRLVEERHVVAEDSGVYRDRWVVSPEQALLGRWSVLAKGEGDSRWDYAGFEVAPQVMGRATEDLLVALGYGFDPRDELAAEFFTPDGLLAGTASGPAREGEALMGAPTVQCVAAGQWTIRVWYHTDAGLNTWVDAPWGSSRGWCIW